MNYPDDLQKLIIQNMEIIEAAPLVVEETEKHVFEAINQKIEKAVMAQEGWDGVYDLVTNKEDDETTFTPVSWPKPEDGSYAVWYTLEATVHSDEMYYLSCATGVKGESLCLSFSLDHDCFELKLKDYKKQLQEFYAENSETLQKYNFSLASDKKSIARPFHFEAGKLAAEFPDLEDSLAPLEAALSDLFAAHGVFDKFVSQL